MASLIAFFSRADNNYVNGEIKDLSVGNTQIAAQHIFDITKADMFKIEPAVAYSRDYSLCIEQAKQDKQRAARPELKGYPQSIAEYDTVYLCYPNYWNTMPMAVFTFLEHFDFSGKTIKPLCTHEGSGMGDSEKDIKHLCPNAKIEKGLAIKGADVAKAVSDIQGWV